MAAQPQNQRYQKCLCYGQALFRIGDTREESNTDVEVNIFIIDQKSASN